MKTRRVVAAWALQAFFALLAVLVFLLSGSATDFHRLVNSIGGILIFLTWFLVVINPLGVEVDGIYEAGISNRKASLWETLTGRGFQPFPGIRTIARVVRPEGRPPGILLIADGGKWRIQPFWDEYVNDFYKELESTLRTGRPSAQWIELPFDDQNLWEKRASWTEARRSAPSPPSDGGTNDDGTTER